MSNYNQTSQLHSDTYGNQWGQETTENDGILFDLPSQEPNYTQKWMPENQEVYKEAIYDKISKLLIGKFSEIEPYIDGTGIEALQKTYRDGKLVKGKGESDLLVVYESDTDANADDKEVESTLLAWLDYVDPGEIQLQIVPVVSDEDSESETGQLSPPNLILSAPNRTELNINDVLSLLDFKDVGLVDNVSQFMEMKQVQTKIDRTKLQEYVDTDFSELTPNTFTQVIDKYNKFKNNVPFDWRADDFFEEYAVTNMPNEYRIQRFFQEFERIKDFIVAGELQGVTSLGDEEDLFGYGTMTYLIKEARKVIDDGDLAIWSNNQVLSWREEIDNLNAQLIAKSIELDNTKTELSLTQESNVSDLVDDLGLTPVNSDEETGGRRGGPVRKMYSGGSAGGKQCIRYKTPDGTIMNGPLQSRDQVCIEWSNGSLKRGGRTRPKPIRNRR